ncbi:unnamed protein product [Schistosoma spindalis]|nr:unnamed protein product [Schistosoma spindale]
MKDDYIIEVNGSLHIFHAKLSHSGTYICKASNIFGISQSTGKLFIRKQTRIISGPLIEQNINTNTTYNSNNSNNNNNKRINMKYLIEGSKIHLTCKVETDPIHENQLKIIWKKDNLTLLDAFEHNDRLNVTSSKNESLIIINLIPSDTGIYTCIASTKLDSVNSSIHLIVQGRPKPPKSIKLLCNYHNQLSPYIMLTWEFDETYYTPIDKVIITYITGFYRPIEDYSISNQYNQSINNNNNNDHNHNNHNHNHLYWLNKTTLSIAQSIINQSIIKNQWNIIDLIPEMKIIDYLKHKNQSLRHYNNTITTITTTTNTSTTYNNNSNIIELPKLPLNIGRAFIQLNYDVIYHFRIELLNHIGKSLPSDIIPKLSIESNELCILPPMPTLINPDYLIVYGNKPNNLIIQWKPLDPVQHNGPGLIYRLTIHCMDCIYGPSKDVFNYTIVKNWSKDRIELTELITSKVSANMNDPNQFDKWNIESFRTYQVTLQAENYLGSSSMKPLIFTGRSGEDIPQLIPIQLRVLYIGSKNLLLSWKIIKDSNFSLKINGLFQGFRIEWCNADLSIDSCEFYKKFQDYILEQPPSWSFPNLRRMSSITFLGNEFKNRDITITTTTTTTNNNNNNDNNNHNNVIDTKSIPITMSSTLEHLHTNKNSSIQYQNDYYKVYLNQLPGKTKLKIWVRILNIQYAGPESDAIIVETKEGVPEKVSELTITFIGVNHIEVSWIKPMILNGNLISYDLEIYLNNYTDKIERITKNSQMISSITIEDPEQCATRISGLKMNTNYSLYIWAKTAVGRGESTFVNFRTATLSHDYGYIPFTITSVQGHVNALNLTLITPLSLSNYDLNQSELINDSTDSSSAANPTTSSFSSSSSSSSSTIPFTNEQDTNNSKIDNDEQIEKWNHQFMFYVQFRELGTEIWEETQRELHNSWIVLNNLHEGLQYEIRIVHITNIGQSTVSGSKIIQIPLINTQSSIINNQWRLLSKHNQYLITVIILCCLFILITLISSICLLIYWFKQKFTKRLITHTKHNYLETFHCKKQSQYNNNNIQYELPIEQQLPQQHQSPRQQQQSMESYTNWTINNKLLPNHIDYITDPMMMMMTTMTTTATATATETTTAMKMMMMNNNHHDTICQLDSSCICQSNDIYHHHHHYHDHDHDSFITTCNSPFINNCITFLKLPQSQTSSFTEENFFNPLINIDTTNTTFTTTNTTDNKNNQHTYIGSLLSRV